MKPGRAKSVVVAAAVVADVADGAGAATAVAAAVAVHAAAAADVIEFLIEKPNSCLVESVECASSSRQAVPR